MSVPSTSDSFVIVGTNQEESNEGTQIEQRSPEMKSMNVVSNVRNRYARTLVTSKYSNPDRHAQEATFSIVLPDTAFIAGFVMEIKGKKYQAYVKEKQEAKQDYDQAVAQGLGAAHVAVSARDSNNFTVSVNVEPLSDVTFILTYEELLVRKHGKYEIVVNLHPGQFIDDLSVEININESRPIINIETPALRSGNEITNEVKINELATIINNEDEAVRISFRPTLEQQKEISKALENRKNKSEKSYKSSEEDKIAGISGQFVVEYDVERDPLGGEVLVNDGYFVHFFAPTELKPIPKHVVFVLDVSGSMSGRKLQQVRDAMTVILDELNPNDYFNLVKFSTDISVLNSKYTWDKIKIPAESNLPHSFEVTDKNIKSVKTVVHKIIDEDCTNIYDALIVGLRLASKGILHLNETDDKHKPQPIIVFLTDGQPNVSESQPKKIIEMVERRNDCDNKSAVFTLAFGDDANKEFLKELAVQNSGFLRNIYEASDASLQLQNFYKEISSPLLTNVNFKYTEEVKEITKHNFDILFNGSEFVVAGKIDDMVDDFVFVEALTLDGMIQFSPTVTTTCPKIEMNKGYGSLERLWAYMTIKQLLDKKYEINEPEANVSTEDNTFREEENKNTKIEIAEKQALNLAIKYSFVTPLTSLVVVKPDETSSEGKIRYSNEQYNDEAEQFRDTDGYNLYSLDVYSGSAMRCTTKSLKSSSPKFSSKLVAAGRKMSFGLVSTGAVGYSGIQELFREKRNSITQLFTKSKDETNYIGLESIQINCNVKNHVATILEKRTYFNFGDTSHEETFTIELPDKAVFTELIMDIDEQIFQANRRDKKQAKKEYKEAVSNSLEAVLLKVEDSNRITVKVYAASNSTVIFNLKYQKNLEKKNDKYEIIINLFRESHTEEMLVEVNINEDRSIKNIDSPYLRSKNDVYSTCPKAGCKKVS